jgi:ankyrin repeat protein
MRARQSLLFGGQAALGISLVVLTVGMLLLGGSVQAADSPLSNAAQLGDLETLQELIAGGADVNVPGGDGSTALLWASYQSYPEMVEALIRAGADPNLANNYGVTPLLQVSRTGDSPLMALLLEVGADPTQTNPEGETPLMAASRSGSVDAVNLLLGRGADPNLAESFQNQTALMWAAAEGHTDVVGTLLGAGADPNLTGRVTTIDERKHADHATGGFTSLHFAVRNGHEEVVKVLIAGGADPTLTNGDGATATSIAIINDRFDLAKTLLDLGADADDGGLYFAVDMRDATTDMRAHDGSRLRADHDNALTALDLVELLLDRGADPNKPFVGQLHSTTLCCTPKINSSPFYRAAVASDVEVLKMMLDHGAEVEWSPAKVETEDGEAGGRGNANAGRTPLMVTLNGGKGAPFAAGPGFTRLGAPPFRDVSNREPLDAVRVLLAAGADPTLKTPDDSTPLHKAVEARQVAIIRELVAAGADLDAVDDENLTPLLVAETPPPPPPPGNNMDARTYRRPQDSREDVIATLRELMGLGPDDPAPVPPPLPEDPEDADAEGEEADGESDGADDSDDSNDSDDSLENEDEEVARASADSETQEPLVQ